jgi:5'-3' exonuclease
MSGEPSVALLDADMMVYRIGFSTENEDEKIAKARLTEWLTDIVYMDLKCEDYKAFITGKGNFRYDIAKTHPYKGNRKDAKKPKHYEALREHLQRLGAEVVEGCEADDAVATEASCGHYWMVHQDKDINQVPGWHYDPTKCVKYYVEPFEGLKNFYTQLLIGDPTDNIKGLWKVGPVKAEKLLADCKTEEDLYKAVCKAYADKGEAPERVLENARLLWLRRTPGELWEPPQ